MFEVTLTLANSAPLDLTPYLKQLYIRLGIHTPIAGTATAGTCYLRLDNSDRRFTPNNASSPYYGLLLPSRRVQVKIDGVTVFVGRLRRITLSSGMYAEREAYFECEDLLSTLQATNISLPLQEKRRADQLIRVILARAFRTATAEGFLRYKMNNPPAVAENDTVTINDVTYRFRATPVQANDVKRESGASRAEQIENLLAAINGGQGEGTRYFTGTKQPTGVRAVHLPLTTTRWIRDRLPVRYYRLDETSGTVAFDIGENKRNATYIGAPTLGVTQSGIWAEDARTCVTLNGTSQFVELPPLDMRSQTFGLHVLVRPSLFTGAPRTLFGFGNNSTSPNDATFSLRLTSDGRVDVVFTGAHGFQTAASSITFGQWQRIIFTFDHYTREAKVWRNDAPLVTHTVPAGVNIALQPTLMRIGRNALTTGEHLACDVAEFALFWRSDLEGFPLDTHTPGIRLIAQTNGTWANGITVSTNSAAFDAGNLTGGADPTGLSLETGIETFELAADQWKESSTNALTAIGQVVESERGFFWQARNGTLVFKNRDYWNGRTIAPVTATSNDHHKATQSGYGLEDIYNRVVVRYTPRRTLTSGVIARTSQAIKAAGRWGATNKPPQGADRYGITQDLPPAGITTVKVPFVDIGRGRIAAAKSLRLPPEPFVDYTANEREDGTGIDYTAHPLHPNVLKFNVASTASDIEVTIENSALGVLYIRNFQLRGEAIVAYEPVEYVREDAESIAQYGVRTLTLDLPLNSDQAYAESLAEYTLGRYKQPCFRLSRLTFENQRYLDTNVPIVNVEIGDVIAVTDYQLGITNQKYMVTGVSYSLSAHKTLSVEFAVRPLEDVTFWILGDATYGVLNSTTRLGA